MRVLMAPAVVAGGAAAALLIPISALAHRVCPPPHEAGKCPAAAAQPTPGSEPVDPGAPTETITFAPPVTPTATSTGGGGGFWAPITNLLGKLNPWTWLNELATAAARPVFGLFGRLVFHTPDLEFHPGSGGNSSVMTMWLTLLALTDASFLAIVLVRAHQLTWGGFSAQVKARRGVGRLVSGALMAHLHLLVVWPIASLANALAKVLVDVGEANLQVKVEQMIPIGVPGVVSPLMTVMMLAATITAVLVIFWSIVRVLVYAMTLVVGPPANMAWAVDQDQLTKAWWRCIVVMLFIPAAQVIVYDLGAAVFFGPHPLFGVSTDFLSALLILVLMWALYQVPKQALRWAASPLMQAFDQAKRKVAVGASLAAIGLGLPVAARGGGLGGSVVRGLMRRRMVSSGRRRQGTPKPAAAKPNQPAGMP
jgi:hypothetical protein